MGRLVSLLRHRLEIEKTRVNGNAGRRAAIDTVWHKIELVIDHDSMTGEHDHRQVLARAASHVALHYSERFEDSGPVRRAVVQEHRLDLRITTALLRGEEGARQVLLIAMSQVQP